MATKQAPNLDADEILGKEFEYIAQAAFQTNEDRARVTSFYLVSVGSFIVALVTSQTESLQVKAVYFAFAGLFLLLFLAGLLTLMQLIRLRAAWLDSVAAMNQIKRFYTEQLPKLQLSEAFRWSDNSRPASFAKGSVSHLLAIQVNVLSACMLTAASVFAVLGLGASPYEFWGVPTGVFFASAGALNRTYRSRLEAFDN